MGFAASGPPLWQASGGWEPTRSDRTPWSSGLGGEARHPKQDKRADSIRPHERLGSNSVTIRRDFTAHGLLGSQSFARKAFLADVRPEGRQVVDPGIR